MAITFPIPVADYFAGLRIASASIYLPEAMEISQTGGGEILTADLGARLWRGSASMVPGLVADVAAAEARLSVLRQSGRSFFACPVGNAYPRADPDGSILGVSAPVIASLAANNRELTISGLPIGYVLSAGDFLSFSYGADPVRYAFHQVVVGSTADALGITGQIEVTPHIRPGAAVAAAVTLIRPAFKAVVIPGSYAAAMIGPRIASGQAFQFQQTLR